MRAAVIVPTLNAGYTWCSWIEALRAAEVAPTDVYVIDSGSTDDTVQLAKSAGFNVSIIDKLEFNHGGTRQAAIYALKGYDYAICLTQDAILYDASAITRLLRPFSSPSVAAVCGRQLPRGGADAIETHARLFNYPGVSSVNSFDDTRRKGLKTAFLSNSFAAYRIDALKKTGGFPSDVIFGEDMYVATKLLQSGCSVAYAADACVYHSHDYSLLQEMKRYFDMGVFHADEPWIRQALGGAESQGVKFILSEFQYLIKHAFWRIPEGMLRTVLRYSGFRLGLVYKQLPVWMVRRLAMNKGYFRTLAPESDKK